MVAIAGGVSTAVAQPPNRGFGFGAPPNPHNHDQLLMPDKSRNGCLGVLNCSGQMTFFNDSFCSDSNRGCNGFYYTHCNNCQCDGYFCEKDSHCRSGQCVCRHRPTRRGYARPPHHRHRCHQGMRAITRRSNASKIRMVEAVARKSAARHAATPPSVVACTTIPRYVGTSIRYVMCVTPAATPG
jgi:hypothetical protein